MRPIYRCLFSLCVAGLAAGCSKQETPLVKQAAVASTPAPAAKQERPKACALVTEAEMTEILGRAVTAKPLNNSACKYSATSGSSANIELTIAWGDAEAAMTGAGMAVRASPGSIDPYAGIGDKAFAIGPSVWIKKGADLITIVFTGVDNSPAKAKQIYETAARRI